MMTLYKSQGDTSVPGNTIATMVTLLLCVAFTYTQIMTSLGEKLIGHILWGIWFMSVVVLKNNQTISILKRKKYVWFYVFFLFYFLSSTIAVGPSVAFNRLIELFEIASPILMFDLYKGINGKMRRLILFVFLILIVINVVILINSIIQYGLGLRLANQDDVQIANSFNWTYSWVLLVTISASLLFNKNQYSDRSKIVVVFLTALFVVGVFVVFRSLFMTAILSMLLGVVTAFFYGKKQWILKTSFTVLVGGLLFQAMYQEIQKQIGFVQDEKGTLSERVEDIYNTLTGKQVRTYDLETRNDLYSVSLTTFFENPITGINHTIKNVESVKYIKVGNHSEWFDNLALYGVFSLFLFFFLVKSANNGLPGMPVVCIVYVFIGFVNPMWYYLQNFITFFFIPLLIQESLPHSLLHTVSQNRVC